VESKREILQARLGDLKAERSKWEPTWRDLSEQFAIELVSDTRTSRNSGKKLDNKILNSKPLRSARTLEAGMMAGITSPARDWYRLAMSDPSFNDAKGVRVWLDLCHDILSAELAGSNFYQALAAAVYPGLVRLGTGAMLMEWPDGGKLRFRPLKPGEYWLDVNDQGHVDTCFREEPMRVRDVVKKFGINNVSQPVRMAYEQKKRNTIVTVIHAIYPNDDYEDGKVGPKGKAFASCWFDPTDARADAMLREEGYDEFPVLCPRWGAANTDAYGRGPAWEARGDARMLQHHEKRLMTLVDKVTDPPMKAQGIDRASLLPGDVTSFGSEPGGLFEPAMTVPPAVIDAVRERIAEVELRIGDCFYERLWNLLIADERNDRPTATEVEAKRQEVMLMLGPLLESMNAELLEPLIERLMAIMLRRGLLPTVPEELEGQQVKIEFISIMHQMQQATGLVSVRAFVGEIGTIAASYPAVLDKVDFDVVADEIGKITGITPKAVLSKEEVEKLREVRAKQAMAEKAGQEALAVTQGAKNLSSVDPSKLSEIAGAFSPVVAAQGGALPGVLAA
jgi:hypothetical protein